MICRKCGESRQLCIRTGLRICYNCSEINQYKIIINECYVCGKKDVVSEFHHLAGKNVNAWYGVQVCINCHMLFSIRQAKHWIKGSHNAVYILQGLYDFTVLTMKTRKKTEHQKSLISNVKLRQNYTEVVRLTYIALCESVGFSIWN
jgi:hypothetical protein